MGLVDGGGAVTALLAVLAGPVPGQGEVEGVEMMGLDLRELPVAQGGQDFDLQLVAVLFQRPGLQMDLGVLREPPLGKFLESGLFTGQDLTVFHPLLKGKGESLHGFFQLLGGEIGLRGESGGLEELLAPDVVAAGDGDAVAAAPLLNTCHGNRPF